jgi:hypothetical protein
VDIVPVEMGAARRVELVLQVARPQGHGTGIKNADALVREKFDQVVLGFVLVRGPGSVWFVLIVCVVSSVSQLAVWAAFTHSTYAFGVVVRKMARPRDSFTEFKTAVDSFSMSYCPGSRPQSPRLKNR